jgi:tRNA (guanine37-N1)-methyltransferase
VLIDVLTIFPSMFAPVVDESILKRAQAKKLLRVRVHDLRDFTLDRHRKVDDRPYGGGSGMVMSVQPIFDAVRAVVRKTRVPKTKRRVILLSPRGRTLTQAVCRELAAVQHLVFICGHYEGVDERVARCVADEEISIGDYVLTGGELGAMVMIDAVARLIPGVLGNDNSAVSESFEGGLLEYPQYTRPADFKGHKDHPKIAAWRHEQALHITKKRRPDLLKKTKERKPWKKSS